jgi:hypothetical protein
MTLKTLIQEKPEEALEEVEWVVWILTTYFPCSWEEAWVAVVECQEACHTDLAVDKEEEILKDSHLDLDESKY